MTGASRALRAGLPSNVADQFLLFTFDLVIGAGEGGGRVENGSVRPVRFGFLFFPDKKKTRV